MIKLEKVYRTPQNQEIMAVKLFLQEKGKLYSLAMGPRGIVIPTGEWILESDFRGPDLYPITRDPYERITEREWRCYRDTGSELYYPLGFHAYSDESSCACMKDNEARYLNETKARHLMRKGFRTIRDVIIRNILAEGVNKFTKLKNSKVYIAQEMLVLK